MARAELRGCAMRPATGGPEAAPPRRRPTAFEAIGLPVPAAYARFRGPRRYVPAATARRPATPLRAAHARAAEIGLVALRAEIEALARRARIDLDAGGEAPAAAEADDPAARLGLTPRELEVLLLVAEGRTNREIGAELFMSEKTASVHVSRILAKLDVSSRVEAAAVAHRLGLTEAAASV